MLPSWIGRGTAGRGSCTSWRRITRRRLASVISRFALRAFPRPATSACGSPSGPSRGSSRATAGSGSSALLDDGLPVLGELLAVVVVRRPRGRSSAGSFVVRELLDEFRARHAPLFTTILIWRSIWRMLSTSVRTESHRRSTCRAAKRICISSVEIFFCSSVLRRLVAVLGQHDQHPREEAPDQ